MNIVLIKYRSPTCDTEEPFMPLFLYTELLDVIKETETHIVVCWNNSEFYTYTFKKEYIKETYS